MKKQTVFQRVSRILCLSLLIPVSIGLIGILPNQPGKSGIAAAQSLATAAVLDSFDRPGAALGSNWSSAGSTIANNQLVGGANDYLFWQTAFSADQWVSVKVIQIPTCNSIDLLLKASGNTKENGLVRINYHSCATPKLIIYTYNTTLKNWTPFKSAVMTLNTGDVFSARVQPNRVVSVFLNGGFVVSDTLPPENAGFETARAGQIGLFTSSNAVILDDFDGGSYDGTGATPVPTSTSAPTQTPLPSSTPPPTQTPLPTQVATNTSIPTLAPTATQPPAPTQTAIAPAAATKTPVPTQTAISAPTTQPPAPTQTAVVPAAPTKTPVPTQTAISAATATKTPVPTQTAIGAATATKTPVPTQTAIGAATATKTLTPSKTATPIRPGAKTATPAQTLTPTQTQTPIPIPSTGPLAFLKVVFIPYVQVSETSPQIDSP